jgi:hypothetical protein
MQRKKGGESPQQGMVFLRKAYRLYRAFKGIFVARA